eukprot:XP_001698789.1 chlamyopsin-6 [Chlamydomonas reinhardtii]
MHAPWPAATLPWLGDTALAKGPQEDNLLRHVHVTIRRIPGPRGCSTGFFVYITASWLSGLWYTTDPLAYAALRAQVPTLVYQMSSTAFFTALVLNLTSLLFEDNAPKRQLALLSCAIKGAACHTDLLLVTGGATVLYDAYGSICIPQRYVQWLVTTPTMVYILSKISDFTPRQTATAIGLDVLMVLSGLVANFLRSPYLWVAFLTSTAAFIGVLYMMGLMVYSAVKEHTSANSRRSLLFIYMCTLFIWNLFPLDWILHVVHRGSPAAEYLNVFANFMAKVLFSSSIMYGNYMTIAQRRLLAQQDAENANRVQMIQDLRDSVTRKDQFMSLMSHELRTPLNGIIQLSDALVRGAGGEMNPKGQHFVRTIKNSSNHLLNIINDILDVAALKEGKLTIKHEVCSLAKAVDHVVDIVAPLAKKEVTMERWVDPATPLIIADFSRVIQILYNLTGNALKFTNKGRVGVRVEPSADGTHVLLQVDMSVTRKYGGTGLGLNIVKQLVEAHEGTIEVASVEGRGTTFTVELPVLQSSTRRSLEGQVLDSLTRLEDTITQFARGVQRRASGLLGRLLFPKMAYRLPQMMNVLSVDDEDINQIVLEEILTDSGYAFARCMDGAEALEWLCASDTMPDLILLDCMMPVMSGHEFCATLRKVIPGNVLPVIMVSAKSDEENIVEGLRSGSNDFLVNNVDGRETESMKLLKNILPESIIARMQQGQKFVADSHGHVVILFSDIVGFTSLSSKLPTAEVFLMLSNMFTAFDKLTDRFSVYKVETIGDAYMVAAGHDEDEDKEAKGSPLMRVLGFARAMLDVVRNITAPNGERLRIRIGVHCGPAFAGVIGMKCPRYCFLGDTVNTASRMESTGFPMCIHVSENVFKHHPAAEAELQEVGERDIKGKGHMRTYVHAPSAAGAVMGSSPAAALQLLLSPNSAGLHSGHANTTLAYLEQRIASLGTQLATEALSRQRLQDELDAERRRAAVASLRAAGGANELLPTSNEANSNADADVIIGGGGMSSTVVPAAQPPSSSAFGSAGAATSGGSGNDDQEITLASPFVSDLPAYALEAGDPPKAQQLQPGSQSTAFVEAGGVGRSGASGGGIAEPLPGSAAEAYSGYSRQQLEDQLLLPPLQLQPPPLPCYSLDALFVDLGLEPYLPRFRDEAIRLDMLLSMDAQQLERLGLKPLGYRIRVREAVVELARGLLRSTAGVSVVHWCRVPVSGGGAAAVAAASG